jgi:hypothetical protein
MNDSERQSDRPTNLSFVVSQQLIHGFDVPWLPVVCKQMGSLPLAASWHSSHDGLKDFAAAFGSKSVPSRTYDVALGVRKSTYQEGDCLMGVHGGKGFYEEHALFCGST